MKAYLFISGTIFAVLGVLNILTTYQHWRQPGMGRAAVVGPAIVALVGLALAIWAFRLTRGLSRPAA